mgnify:CR=1 FL=1
MRRFLAILGLILIISGFVLLPLSLQFNIPFYIPVGLILAAFLIMLYVKKMPSPYDDDNSGNEGER